MPNKRDPFIDQVAQFLVGAFQSGQVFGWDRGIQIPGLDPWELGQVIHNLEHDKHQIQNIITSLQLWLQ